MRNKHFTGLDVLIVCFLILACVGSEIAAAESAASIEILYTGNEGVLITSAGKKIFIDALFPKTLPDYAAPTEEVLEKMENGKAPFDNIDLILTTHNHPDHFGAASVARCMKSNPDAEFISTPQAVEDIKKLGNDYDLIKDRITAVPLAVNAHVVMTINGIPLKIFRTKHSGDRESIENLMFLLTVGGKKIFHEGDSNADPEVFKSFDLSGEGIDVGLVHFWFPFHEKGYEILTQSLKPKQVVLIHLPNRLIEDAQSKLPLVHKEFPGAVLFFETGQKVRF
jgi:L-ascorbate metabolism protein UlaG (beta-lactamase superfamily)